MREEKHKNLEAFSNPLAPPMNRLIAPMRFEIPTRIHLDLLPPSPAISLVPLTIIPLQRPTLPLALRHVPHLLSPLRLRPPPLPPHVLIVPFPDFDLFGVGRGAAIVQQRLPVPFALRRIACLLRARLLVLLMPAAPVLSSWWSGGGVTSFFCVPVAVVVVVVVVAVGPAGFAGSGAAHGRCWCFLGCE